MPNWCNNVLNIRAKSPKDLLDFLEKVQGEEETFLLQNLYPMPKELEDIDSPPIHTDPEKVEETLRERNKNFNWGLSEEELAKRIEEAKADAEKAKIYREKYGYSNWYDWRVDNWGTKWDVDAHIDILTDTEARVVFDSAWAPPCAWLKNIAPDFPNVKFHLEYEEAGWGFQGNTYAFRDEFDDYCVEMCSVGWRMDEDDWDE